MKEEYSSEIKENNKSFSVKQKKWLEQFDSATAGAQKNLTEVADIADKHFEKLGQDAKGLGQDIKSVS